MKTKAGVRKVRSESAVIVNQTIKGFPDLFGTERDELRRGVWGAQGRERVREVGRV